MATETNPSPENPGTNPSDVSFLAESRMTGWTLLMVKNPVMISKNANPRRPTLRFFTVFSSILAAQVKMTLSNKSLFNGQFVLFTMVM